MRSLYIILTIALWFFCSLASINCASSLLEIQVTGANPTYLEFCITSKRTVTKVDIKTYDWDTDTESPKRVWMTMEQTNYDDKCWTFQADSSIIYLPASLRLTAGGIGKQLDLTNILTSLSFPLTLTAPDFDSSDPYVPPADTPLVYVLNPSGNTSTYSAGATHFDPTNYACSFQPVAPYNDMYAAIRVQDWKTSEVCGQCLTMCNGTGHSVEVMVVDQCPFPNLCTRYHWLDISPKAFSILSNGNNGWGVQQLSWRFVECSGIPSSTNMSYVLEDWSKNYGFAMQIRNYRLGLKTIAIQSKSGRPAEWIQLNRTASNYFSYDTGSTIQCPCRLKLTSISGEELIDENAFKADIGSLPKETPISGNVQFTSVPHEYQTSNGHCIPSAPAEPSDIHKSPTPVHPSPKLSTPGGIPSSQHGSLSPKPKPSDIGPKDIIGGSADLNGARSSMLLLLVCLLHMVAVFVQ